MTNLHLVSDIEASSPTQRVRPIGARVHFFFGSRWHVANRKYFRYVTKLWWDLGYEAGLKAARESAGRRR